MNIPERVTKLEQEMTQVERNADDALTLARHADRDISDIRVELHAHRKLIEALQESQVERFNDLDNRMREGFRQVHEAFGQVNERFGQVNEAFGQVNERFDQVNERFGQVDEGFGKLAAGQAHILALLTTALERDS